MPSLKTLFTSIIAHRKNLAYVASVIIACSFLLATLGINLTKFKPPGISKLITKITTPFTENNIEDGFTKLEIKERETPFFTLTPESANKYGILPRQTFILTAKQAVGPKFVESSLKSNFPFTVSALSDREFKIIPGATAGLDQIVKLTLAVKDSSENEHVFDRDYGWSFQTQGKFRVKSSLPGDKKRDIPLNTGIEFVFSQDDYKDPTPLIKTEPAFQFRTEKHGETFAIVPLSPLSPETIYTITLTKGLGITSRNDTLSEDYQFSFQTQAPVEVKNSPNLSISDTFVQIAPNELPATKIHTYNWNPEITVKAEIYKFNSGEAFVKSRRNYDTFSNYWYRYQFEDDKIDTTTLTLTGTAELKPQNRTQGGLEMDYLQLPEVLKPGLYLVQFWYDNHTRVEQMWIQSNYLSAYTTAGRNQTLVWVNDIETGKPVNGAKVILTGSSENHYTSENGITVFTTPANLYSEGTHYLEITRPETPGIYLPIRSLDGNETNTEESANDYWSYLYHERSMYKNSDTVNFWGVVKNRDTNQAPATMKIILSSGYAWQDPNPVTEKTVNVNSDGSFNGSISYSDLPADWYVLSAVTNNVRVAFGGFQILEYEKPEMKIEVETNRKAVFTGEQIIFTGRASFFDGTPVRDVVLTVHEDITGATQQVTTDAKGEISYAYTPIYSNMRNYPRYEGVTITPSMSERATIEGNGSVYVYGSKLMITSDNNQDKSQAFVKARINNVILTGVNAGTTSEVTGNPAGDQDVSMTITKNWWVRVETGTYYDYVEKVTQPSYRYDKKQEKILDQKFRTNQNGEISHNFTMEKEKSYDVIMTVNDRDGHAAESREYYYYYTDDADSENNSGGSSPQLNLNKKESVYSLGESVEATIKQNNKTYPDTDHDSYLFIEARRGRQDFHVTDSPKLNIVFEPKHIPNFSIGAVIFSGKQYQSVSGGCQWDWYCYDFYYDYNYFSSVQVSYKQEDRELEVKVSADKNTYKPGDTAKFSVSVAKGNNLPVYEAEVNLILVDQALASIGGVVPPSILSSLYKSVPHQIYFSYYTHKPIFPDEPQAEKGGGGGDSREIFKDTAFFGRAKTNENGVAQFEFQLPDDITTWVVYGQALTRDLEAGQIQAAVAVSKEFFVTNQFPREYLNSDKPMLAIAGFGNSLKPGDKVNYQAIFLQNTEEISKTEKAGQAYLQTNFTAPTLANGNYKVWAKGTKDNLTDGVILPFSIIDSRISFKYKQNFTIETGKEPIKPILGKFQADRPITMVVSDIGKGKYYHQLRDFCYTSSNRLEKRLSSVEAARILESRFTDSKCISSDSQLTGFQSNDGGLAQVTWGGSDLETTLWATVIKKDAFNKEELIKYYRKMLDEGNSGTIQKLQAAWGLTMLDKPQVTTINNLADTAISFEEKSVAGLALAYTGQTEKAREIYLDILANWGYAAKPYVRIQRNDTRDSDKWLADTAKTLVLGSLVDKTYDAGMYAYIKGYGRLADDIVLNLAQMAFIEEEISKLPDQDTLVNISSSTRQESISLVRGRSRTISLNASELPGLTIKPVTGKAEAAIHYFVGAEGLATIPEDGRLTINRSYKNTSGKTSIVPGDIVEITIQMNTNSDSPLGSYQVFELLPSGLVYLPNPEMYGLKSYGWINVEGNNRLKGYYSNSRWWTDKQIVYYARAAYPGTYTAEPAILQSNLEPSVFQATASEIIKIEGNQ